MALTRDEQGYSAGTIGTIVDTDPVLSSIFVEIWDDLLVIPRDALAPATPADIAAARRPALPVAA